MVAQVTRPGRTPWPTLFALLLFLLMAASPVVAEDSSPLVSLIPGGALSLSSGENNLSRDPAIHSSGCWLVSGRPIAPPSNTTAATIWRRPALGPTSPDWTATRRSPRKLIASLPSAGLIAGSAANSFIAAHQKFHFLDEGFFGAGTYAGGADKASHFADFFVISKELAKFYALLGYSERQSIWMGFGVSTPAGLVIELGDGTTKFGFSYEDFVMDALGAGSAAFIASVGAEDVVGVRTSRMPTGNYAHDVYAADIKIAGVARRLGLNVGPLR